MIGLLTDRQNTAAEEIVDEPMPTNGEIAAQEKFVLPVVPDASGKSINLSTLLEYAIQATYAELNSLSDHLRNLTDLDRKLAINRFATSTRRLFLKLYALVKWLKSSKRFDTLNSICYLLDQQSSYFVDTADRFLLIAHEELVFCRLPIFQISTAIDALSLGSFPRLPQIIKKEPRERPLTYRQTKLTIRRLNKMMEYRLGQEAALIPAGIHDILVADGVTTFTANGEFVLKMTLMRNDWPNDDELRGWAWTIVDLKFLVENIDVGMGRELVHPTQLEQLREFCQSRMYNGVRDISIVYTILHNFTMSLQLDAYHFEAIFLADAVSPKFVDVEFYDEREKYLRLKYWGVPDRQMPYRIEIFFTYYEQTAGDPWMARLLHQPLRLRHYPPAPGLPEFEMDGSYPSLRSIMDRAVLVRTQHLMLSVRDLFQSFRRSDPRIKRKSWGEIRAEFRIMSGEFEPLAERLRISVNMLTGKFVCELDNLANGAELKDFEDTLNAGQYPASTRENYFALKKGIQRLQIALLIQRHLKGFNSVLLEPCDFPQPVFEVLKRMVKLPKTRFLFEFVENRCYYLLAVFRYIVEPMPDVFMKVYSIAKVGDLPNVVELDLESIAQMYPFPTAAPETLDIRKTCRENITVLRRRVQLAISTLNDHIQFRGLADELNALALQPDPLVGEPVVGGYILTLRNLRPLLADDAGDEFLSKVAVAAIRVDTMAQKHRVGERNGPQGCRNGFPFEVSIADPPLVSDYGRNGQLAKYQNRIYTHVQDIFIGGGGSDANRENTQRDPSQRENNPKENPDAVATNESVYESVRHRLWTYEQTYRIIRDFAATYEIYYKDHCNIVLYTFHKLILAYGRHRNQLFTFTAKCQRQSMGEGQPPGPEQTVYLLAFFQAQRPALTDEELRSPKSVGRRKRKEKISQSSRAWNAHTFLSQPLRDNFNQKPDLCTLVNFLINTDRSLSAIFHFSETRLATLKSYAQILGLPDKDFPVELKTHLMMLKQDHVRLCYGVSHLDFQLLAENRVLVSAHRLHDSVRRDYDHDLDGLPFFRDFWNQMSIDTVRDTGKLVEDLSNFDFMKIDSGPHSIPPRSSRDEDDEPVAEADKPNPPPSCTPRICDDPAPDQSASAPPPNLASPNSQLQSGSRYLPLPIPQLVVGIEALEKAVTAVPLNDPKPDDPPQQKPLHWKPPERIPLDDYLLSITFMARIGPAIEMCSRSIHAGRPHLPISDLHWSNRAVSFDVAGIPTNSNPQGPTPGAPPPQPSSWNIRMRFFICPEKFRVKCTLTFVSTGAKTPDQTDVDVFVRYFEQVVAPLCNEFAVISFITMCRITSAGVFSAFARIMQAQMEPLLPFYWYVSLQLVAFPNPKEQLAPGTPPMMRCGVVLNQGERGRVVLLMLLLRKSRAFAKANRNSQRPTDENAERQKPEEKQWFSKSVPLAYNLETNQMMVLRSNDTSPELEPIVQKAMALQNANRECSIWPCVRIILEEFLRPADPVPTPLPGAQPQNPLLSQTPHHSQMGMFPTDGGANPNLAAELSNNPNMPMPTQRMHTSGNPMSNPMQNPMMGNHPSAPSAGPPPSMSGASTLPPMGNPLMGNQMSSGQPPMGPLGSNNPMSNAGMSTGASMSVGGPASMGSMASTGPMGTAGSVPMGSTGPMGTNPMGPSSLPLNVGQMGTPGGMPIGSTGPMGSTGAPPSVSSSSLNPRSAGAPGNGPSPLGTNSAVTPGSLGNPGSMGSATNVPTGPMGGQQGIGMHSGMMQTQPNPQPSGSQTAPMGAGGPNPSQSGGPMSGMRPMGGMPMHGGMMGQGGPMGSGPMGASGPMGGPMGQMGAGGPMSGQQPMNPGGSMMGQGGQMGPGGPMGGRGGPHGMHPMQSMGTHPNAPQMQPMGGAGPMMGGSQMPHQMPGGNHPGMGMGGMPPHSQQPPKDYQYR